MDHGQNYSITNAQLTPEQTSLVNRYITRAFDAYFSAGAIVAKHKFPIETIGEIDNYIAANADYFGVKTIDFDFLNSSNILWHRSNSLYQDLPYVENIVQNIMERKGDVSLSDLVNEEDFSGNLVLLSNMLKLSKKRIANEG